MTVTLPADPTATESELLGQVVLAITQAANEAEVLIALAQHVDRLIPASRVSIVLVDSPTGDARVFALSGETDVIPVGSRIDLAESHVGEAVRSRTLRVWAPTADDCRKNTRLLAEQGMRTVLNAPLVVGEACLGALNLASGRPNAFGPQQQKLCSIVTSLAAAAIERMRLLESTKHSLERHRRYAERLEILNDISSNLSAAMDEAAVFEVIAQGVLRILPAFRVSYAELDTPAGVFHIRGLVGVASQLNRGATVPMKGSGLGHALAQGSSQFFPDLSDTPYSEHALLHASGATAGVTYPIRVGQDIVGLLNIAVKDVHLLDGETRFLLHTFAQLTGSTMERVFAHDELATALEEQARIDPLTELANRRAFDEHLEMAFALAHREQDSVESCLLLLDIDQFKIVNDTCGHVPGDLLLKQVADAFSTRVGRQDLVARFGGDEFAVVLHGCSVADGLAVGERLRAAVEELVFVHGDSRFPVTISVGVASIGSETPSCAEILAIADAAMYRSKRAGRNRVTEGSAEDHTVSRRLGDLAWISRTRHALAHNGLVVYGQVIRPLKPTGPGLHFESLVRMIGDDGELIPPISFIPAAERLGLVPDIDLWVIRETLKLVAESQRAVAGVALNLSVVSLESEAFLVQLIDILDRTPFPTDRLCFEITESVAVSNFRRVSEFIASLAFRGCQVALDDFGAGFSAFRHLRLLPVDIIKIDGGLVRNVTSDPVSLASVRAIHEVAAATTKRSVAEFVEDQETLDCVIEMGIDFAQGYAIGRPRPLTELLTDH